MCRAAAITVAAGAVVAAGCASKPTAPRAGGAGAANRVRKTSEAPDSRSRVDTLGFTEPAANHLHDLSGPLLMYYAVHRRLPPTLDDLATMMDADQTPDFTSPASGRPLVYDPSAVPPPGDDRRLVLYDPTPTARRSYWAILMGSPRGNQPAATWVVELPEQALRNYAAATTRPAEGQ